ncbi:hypothetical protein [Tautonia sociabilis]|uniref:Uncharacterized protein n=1 Tax=Tautonia sociabilis TaxID=2080755 RepID=A0A432MGV0_9BACT|nr:hypothetical protein [Tautonia sociabilis]RUL85748.1 hypothetical protein TsocGM_17925 [Tautonia sociabilis]
MIPADSYLHIPEAYGRWLGGLRWSDGGEAVEFPSGETFAFSRELSLFLEGFAAGRDPIHFAHILHLMHLLLRGPLNREPAMPMDLVGGFAVLGRPHRNAGAFCSRLCAEVPGLPDPPDVEAVLRLLVAGAAVGDYRELDEDAGLVLWGDYGGGARGGWPGGDRSAPPPIDEPPLPPAHFERLVLERLARQTPEQVRHWFRHGRAPEADASAVADRVEAELPRSFREALEPLLDRPRLAGSAGLLDRLVGALALPPRRLAREALPTGGYADLSHRGLPERLLPSQHAIDPDEFLRRFAEHELLYYRREEPHAPESEELLVLIDQGVRTWGAVRSVLAAAAVALGRLADRRGVGMRLGTSAAPGRLVDPILADPEELASLLEASDLSPHPGPLLASALVEPASPAAGPPRRRDVVLLTHPRSLDEPEVEALARVLPPGDRLFALAVDDRRDVQLAELRRGRPVPLARFRAEPINRSLAPAPSPVPTPAPGDWGGDVEPIGFPFRCPPCGGPPPKGSGPMFAFDEAGEWLAAVGPHGVPHAWRVDGSAAQAWPRGFSGGEVVRTVDALIGVAGGFAVIGRLGDGDRPVAVHYDLISRTVRTYVKYLSDAPVWDWFYLRESHALIARGPDESWYVDLRTGGRYSSQDRCSSEAIARDLARVDALSIPPPRLLTLHDDDTRPSTGPSARLRRATGTITLDGVPLSWRPFRPVSDGQPVLAGRRLERALYRGRTLALYVPGRGGAGASPSCWLLFQGPDPTRLPDRPALGPDDLALSADGALVAVRAGENRYAVHAAADPGPPLLTTPRAGISGRPHIGLGRDWMAIHEGPQVTLVRWDRGALDVRSASIDLASTLSDPTRGGLGSPMLATDRRGHLPAWASYDRRRFKATCRGVGLVAVIDAFGHVALADPSGTLVCILLASRGRLAAWLPDGTRLGPAELTGAPPSPGASARIAEALREASRRA